MILGIHGLTSSYQVKTTFSFICDALVVLSIDELHFDNDINS